MFIRPPLLPNDEASSSPGAADIAGLMGAPPPVRDHRDHGDRRDHLDHHRDGGRDGRSGCGEVAFGGERRRSRLTPDEEDVSRAMTDIARHKAYKRNIAIRPDGYMRLSEVCREVHVSEEIGQDVAAKSERHGRPRFEMLSDQGEIWIRATNKVSLRDEKGAPIVANQAQGLCHRPLPGTSRMASLGDDQADKAIIAALRAENADLQERVRELEAQLGQQQGQQPPPPPGLLRQPPPPSEPQTERSEARPTLEAALHMPLTSSTLSTATGGDVSTSPGGVAIPPRPPPPPADMPGVALQAGAVESQSSSRSSSMSAPGAPPSIKPEQPQPQQQQQQEEQMSTPSSPPQPEQPQQQQQEEQAPKFFYGYQVIASHVAEDDSQVGLDVGESLNWCMPTEYPGWFYVEKSLHNKRGYVLEVCLRPPPQQAPEAEVDV